MCVRDSSTWWYGLGSVGYRWGNETKGVGSIRWVVVVVTDGRTDLVVAPDHEVLLELDGEGQVRVPALRLAQVLQLFRLIDCVGLLESGDDRKYKGRKDALQSVRQVGSLLPTSEWNSARRFSTSRYRRLRPRMGRRSCDSGSCSLLWVMGTGGMYVWLWSRMR